MKASWQRVAAMAAILGGTVCAAGKDAAGARALLKELAAPVPLAPKVRRQVRKLLADLGSKDWQVRDAASRELLRIGPKAEPLVRQTLDSSDAEVALRARRLLEAYQARLANRPSVLDESIDLLAKHNDKTVIDSLVVLLDHEKASIRHVTEYGLRRLTGRQFGYNAHAPEPRRRVAAAKWAAWWKASRRKFDLVAAGSERGSSGVLCWHPPTREVFFLGRDGKVVWSRKMPKRFYDADALPNGHILISAFEGKQTILEEYDRSGKVVWRAEALDVPGMAGSVARLPGGGALMVHPVGRRVVEIDPSGKKIVWQVPFPGICSAQRLANGNTLLCSLKGEMREVTRAGEAVWTRKWPTRTRGARKLPNGNVLIAEYTGGRVVEIAESGQPVWSWTGKEIGPVIRARRLPDGRTVVQTMKTGLLMVDVAGRHAERLSVGGKPLTWGCHPKIRLAPAGPARPR